MWSDLTFVWSELTLSDITMNRSEVAGYLFQPVSNSYLYVMKSAAMLVYFRRNSMSMFSV